ncbi:hypothetical protein HDE_13960 [Halotydeus destructor]|nr:hypothetical protein HDE_13960 [Halotydeus destructor]
MAGCLIHTFVVIFIMFMLTVFTMLLAMYHKDSRHRVPLLKLKNCPKCPDLEPEVELCQSQFTGLVKVYEVGDSDSVNGSRVLDMIVVRTFRNVQTSGDRNLDKILLTGLPVCAFDFEPHRMYLISATLATLDLGGHLGPALAVGPCDLAVDWTPLTIRERSRYLDIFSADRLCERLKL